MSAKTDGETGDQPVGPVVDGTPAGRPEPVVFDGRFARAEKLDAARHADDLWQAVKDDDRLWTYMAYGPFPDRASFDRWFEERVVSLDPYAYAVIDKASGKAVGSVTLMEIRPAARVIEIGSIVYAPALQRTAAGTEVQYLMARYVFETLGYRRYEWKCHDLNAKSKRAAERFGFIYEGTFRQHMIVKGRNRDTAWFSMLDSEWPAIRAAYERWLAPDNFDTAGRQKARLAMQKRETK
jgi:RimJ/RimL family protein N-acetyltransferase